MGGRRLVPIYTYEHGGGAEHVAERIIDEVEKRCGIEVGISHDLRREKCLARAGAEQTAHHSVCQIHPVSHLTYPVPQFGYVRLLHCATVQVSKI